MLHPGKILINALASAVADPGCKPPPPGPQANWIPNVPVRTHRDETARFYDDLVRPRIVLINCMSIGDPVGCSHTETMAQVQPLLGEDLGRSVFIYSITTEPEHDTPSALRAFAEKYGARDGWLFLTGDPSDLKLLRARLFTRDGGQDCSLHLVRYGNESVGLWGGLPAHCRAESIAQRISWITPRERPAGPPIRGGPMPLDSGSV